MSPSPPTPPAGLRLWPPVPGPDVNAAAAARTRLDRLTKPPGSLGRLEELAVRLAAMTGAVGSPVRPATVVVMAADHGVTREGVSAYPPEVTAQMVVNFLRRGAAINVLAAQMGLAVRVVDMGVNGEISCPVDPVPGLAFECRKVRAGTANMAEEPAMSQQEALQAITAGLEVGAAEVDRGTRVLCLGEMGIGNTTAASAVLAAVAGLDPQHVAGPGTGLGPGGVRHKAEVISRALRRHCPDGRDPLGLVAAVGGLEIAGLAGVILAAAAARRPVILDGFITGAAALVAAAIRPEVKDYLIASHRSAEPAHGAVLERLGLVPLLDLGLRLGEGTGAVLAFTLLEAAQNIITKMATFASAGVAGADADRTRTGG